MLQQNGLALKTWNQDAQSITIFFAESHIYAKIFSVAGEVMHVPEYDIDIPSHLKLSRNTRILGAYLQNTHVRIAKRSDRSIGLYINQQLNGGGWIDGALSAIAIAGGIGLTIAGAAATVPFFVVAAPILGSVLLSAGVNGLSEACKTNENFSAEFKKEVAIGAVTGLVLGVASVGAGAITAQAKGIKMISDASKLGGETAKIGAKTVTLVSKVAINAAGGAAAEVASQMTEQMLTTDSGKLAVDLHKIDPHKINKTRVVVRSGASAVASLLVSSQHLNKADSATETGKKELGEKIAAWLKPEVVPMIVINAGGGAIVDKMITHVANNKCAAAQAQSHTALAQQLASTRAAQDLSEQQAHEIELLTKQVDEKTKTTKKNDRELQELRNKVKQQEQASQTTTTTTSSANLNNLDSTTSTNNITNATSSATATTPSIDATRNSQIAGQEDTEQSINAPGLRHRKKAANTPSTSIPFGAHPNTTFGSQAHLSKATATMQQQSANSISPQSADTMFDDASDNNSDSDDCVMPTQISLN